MHLTDHPLIRELDPLLNSSLMQGHLGIPKLSLTALDAAHQSVSHLHHIKKAASTYIQQVAKEELNSHIGELTVQKKLTDITELEEHNKLWKRIMLGLRIPLGQLSFLLHESRL